MEKAGACSSEANIAFEEESSQKIKKKVFSSQRGFYTQAELTGHHRHWLLAIKLTLNLIVASHAGPTPELALIQLLMVDRHAFSLCL